MKHTLEKQILNQPKEILFCKKCVMSNQRPRIIFDSDGICGGCRNNELYKKILIGIKEKKSFTSCWINIAAKMESGTLLFQVVGVKTLLM